jgi:hypothetical protein
MIEREREYTPDFSVGCGQCEYAQELSGLTCLDVDCACNCHIDNEQFMPSEDKEDDGY